MTYTAKDWHRRIAERTDMCSYITHLTRETAENKCEDNLFNMLKEKKIIGSTTSSGFIVGSTSAVCFQDTPLTSICQNTFFEQKQRESDKNYKLRYRAFGLMFDKRYAFKKGARPVVYDKTAIAKDYLPENQWWRIVNFNLESDDQIIDWSHEREWRYPNDFEFELSEVTLVTIRQHSISTLTKKFKNELNIDLMKEIKGVVTLEHLLY